MNAEELLAKARALVRALQARAEAGDKLRMLPEEMAKDFVRERLFPILVPERFPLVLAMLMLGQGSNLQVAGGEQKKRRWRIR